MSRTYIRNMWMLYALCMRYMRIFACICECVRVPLCVRNINISPSAFIYTWVCEFVCASCLGLWVLYVMYVRHHPRCSVARDSVCGETASSKRNIYGEIQCPCTDTLFYVHVWYWFWNFVTVLKSLILRTIKM